MSTPGPLRYKIHPELVPLKLGTAYSSPIHLTLAEIALERDEHARHWLRTIVELGRPSILASLHATDDWRYNGALRMRPDILSCLSVHSQPHRRVARLDSIRSLGCRLHMCMTMLARWLRLHTRFQIPCKL